MSLSHHSYKNDSAMSLNHGVNELAGGEGDVSSDVS